MAKNKSEILVVLSSEDKLLLSNGRALKTGNFLSELMIPLMHLIDNGFKPVFANPRGTPVMIDQRSWSRFWFGNNTEKYERALELLRRLDGLKKPRKLSEILFGNLDRFSGLFVPGGHSPMADLPTCEPLGPILRHFHENQKPTAMICHGPVGLVAACSRPFEFLNLLSKRHLDRKFVGDWPYAGYRMTVYPNSQERLFFALNALTGTRGLPMFYAKDALKACGATVENNLMGKVVSDRELITGQDPFSAEMLAATFVERLSAARSTEHIGVKAA